MPCIGKYRLLGLLGRGSTGSVYKVMDPSQNRLMAMKVLRPGRIMLDIVGFEELKRRFLKEAAIMKQLQHRHVADIFEVGEYNSLPFMVQEYLCLNLGILIGESRRVELSTRVLSPLKALKIISQVLEALSGLHESGLAYRDVKPENIMLSKKGRVKIIDFGLSRFIADKDQTPGGMIIGSPYYAAPEQVENPERGDQRSDIYSAGVVLYRMVTGSLPAINEIDISRHSLLGPGWESLLKKALAADPEQRFPEAVSMGREIEGLRRDWEKRREQVCALPGENNKTMDRDYSPLRSRPVHTGRAGPEGLGNLNSLMQPRKFIENEFQKTGQGIWDQATGLIWANGISPEQLSYDQGLQYVRELNRKNPPEGQADPWRLPTVEELMSLLGPRQSLDDFCGPDFWNFKDRSWLWSADARTRTKAWIVDMDQGAALAQDRKCGFHVLPVRQASCA